MDGQVEIQQRLRLAFPHSVHPCLDTVLPLLPATDRPLSPDDIGPVLLNGAPLAIPARLYFPELPTGIYRGLDRAQQAVISCLYSRHANGHIRERHLRILLSSDPSWVVPFVFALVGEYVVELIELIEEAAKQSDQRQRLATFGRGAPDFCALTCRRAVSYWNCYYQPRFPRFIDYPAFRLLDSLGVWPEEEARSLRR